MAFTSITKKTVGEWLTKVFLDFIIDNLNWIYSQIAPSARMNMVANPSFEITEGGEPVGYDITDRTGGSHAIDTGVHLHGKQSLKFTSTVLANGGSYADDEDFMEVQGGKSYYWLYIREASAINISSQLEARWYDESQSYLSSSTLNQDTSTPTTIADTDGNVAAPAGARFVKLRREGGVPAVGTATGDVHFDYARLVPVIAEAQMDDSSVARASLKTSTVSLAGAIATGGGTSFVLNGYAFFPMIHSAGIGSGAGLAGHGTDQVDPDSPAFRIHNGSSKVAGTYDVDYRYIDA